jgi:predicted hotdog family 3-hydroxylacyl-ACP dehydratase
LIGCRKYASDVAVFPEGAILRIRITELDVMDKSLGAFDCTIGDPDTIVTARLMVYGRSREGVEESFVVNESSR